MKKKFCILPIKYSEDQIKGWREKIADPDFVEKFPTKSTLFKLFLEEYDLGHVLKNKDGVFFIKEVLEVQNGKKST